MRCRWLAFDFCTRLNIGVANHDKFHMVQRETNHSEDLWFGCLEISANFHQSATRKCSTKEYTMANTEAAKLLFALLTSLWNFVSVIDKVEMIRRGSELCSIISREVQ